MNRMFQSFPHLLVLTYFVCAFALGSNEQCVSELAAEDLKPDQIISSPMQNPTSFAVSRDGLQVAIGSYGGTYVKTTKFGDNISVTKSEGERKAWLPTFVGYLEDDALVMCHDRKIRIEGPGYSHEISLPSPAVRMKISPPRDRLGVILESGRVLEYRFSGENYDLFNWVRGGYIWKTVDFTWQEGYGHWDKSMIIIYEGWKNLIFYRTHLKRPSFEPQFKDQELDFKKTPKFWGWEKQESPPELEAVHRLDWNHYLVFPRNYPTYDGQWHLGGFETWHKAYVIVLVGAFESLMNEPIFFGSRIGRAGNAKPVLHSSAVHRSTNQVAWSVSEGEDHLLNYSHRTPPKDREKEGAVGFTSNVLGKWKRPISHVQFSDSGDEIIWVDEAGELGWSTPPKK